MSEKVAIVTGSNKGIGFAIAKGLCSRFDGVVYLTSRDENRGAEAVLELKNLGFRPRYHQLDVSDKTSVERFRDHIKENYAGIDILINNAAIAVVSLKNIYEDSKNVVDINYEGIKTVEDLLFPLLKYGARVLNISSDCGHLSNIRNEEWIKKLSNKDLTRSDLDDFVEWYLESVKKGTFKRTDFADNGSISAYRVSKVALSALTMLQQRDLEPRGVIVNSMHPGLVSTDMSMGIGFYNADEAAATPLYLVLDAPSIIKGAYVWHDKTVLDWYDYKADYYFKTRSLGTQILKNMFKFKYSTIQHVLVGVLSLALIVGITKIFKT